MDTKIPDIRPNYHEVNYDAEKIAPYTLEDPLTFLDGSKVKNSEDWKKRRQEILSIFANEMFGSQPPVPEAVTFDLLYKKNKALAGFAVISEYKVYFTEDKSGPAVNFLVIRPRHAKKAAPPVIFHNYRGNHQLIPDSEVTIPDMWAGLIKGYKVPVERGVMNNPDEDTVMPIGMLLSAGYAVVTACYCQISPDPYEKEKDQYSQDTFAYTGVFDLWGKRDENRTDKQEQKGRRKVDLDRLGLRPQLLKKRKEISLCQSNDKKNAKRDKKKCGKSHPDLHLHPLFRLISDSSIIAEILQNGNRKSKPTTKKSGCRLASAF
jgi:hypothetical protein